MVQTVPLASARVNKYSVDNEEDEEEDDDDEGEDEVLSLLLFETSFFLQYIVT